MQTTITFESAVPGWMLTTNAVKNGLHETVHYDAWLYRKGEEPTENSYIGMWEDIDTLESSVPDIIANQNG